MILRPIVRWMGKLRGQVVVAGLLLSACGAMPASASVTVDRSYTFGDDVAEGAMDGLAMGIGSSGFTYDNAGAPGAGDLQDLLVFGSPQYVDVTGRPMLVGSGLGASFSGAGDYLTGLRFNSPNEIWDSADINQFAPPYFPHNYDGLVTRGFQLWVKPDAAKQGSMQRQDIVLDTFEHGLYITENDTWGLQFDDISRDTGVPVAYGQWTHVFHRVLSGATGAALYLDGVAVITAGDTYDNSTAPLVVGSNLANDGNFYQGQLDDLQMFLWGDNSAAAVGSQGQVGMNYGAINVGTDNAWIAGTLAAMGVTDPADVNLDGDVDNDDIAALKVGWRTQHLVTGRQVGDWISRQNGDLNYDGLVNLADAYLLHEGLVAGGSPGIDFPSFLASVPEPSTWALLGVGGALLAAARGKRLAAAIVRRGRDKAVGPILCAAAAAGLALLCAAQARAVEVFHADFDNPTVGAIGNTAPLIIGSGTVNGTTNAPQRHDYLSGNWARLNSNSNVTWDPTTSTEIAGTTASFDFWTSSSGAVGRVFHVAGMQGDTELFRVGFDMQQQLYVNGSSASDIVVEPNNAFQALNWTKVSVTLNATDWDLTIQQYAPPGSTSGSEIVTITDPVGMPSGPMDTYTFPYLNSGTYLSAIVIDGSSGTSGSAPLEFFDNLQWSGTASPYEDRPVLQIDRDTGAMTLRNNTPDAIPMLGYSILSNAGALNSNAWTSVAGNYDAAVGGDQSIDSDDAWFVLSGDDARTDLSEFQPDGDGGALGSLQTVSLGNAWFRNPVEDISVELLLADGTISTANVEYVGNGGVAFAFGDLNFNGAVDIGDWGVLKAGYGGAGLSTAESYGLGDLNGDLVVDLADTLVFRKLYDAANGAGAFSRAVPEPGSWLLLGVGGALLCVARGKRIVAKLADRGCDQTVGALLCVMVVAGFGLVCAPQVRAAEVFHADFDNPTVGSIGNEAALLIGSGTVNGTTNAPQRHEYLSGNWARLFSANDVSLKPTTPTKFEGTTASFDFWESTSGAANRVWHFAAMQGDVELFRVGFDMQQNLLVNGSTPGDIVVEPNDAYQGLNWTKVSVTLNATDWTLNVQQYAPPGSTTGDAIVTITDPIGSPSGPIDSYTFPYLNTPSYVSELRLDGSSGTGTAPLEFFDNIVWNGTAGPLPTLRVNTTTGVVQILNASDTAVDLNGYSISSAANALDAGALSALQGQVGYGNGNDTDGIGWEILGAPSSGLIAESALSGSNAFVDGGGGVSLGAIFNGAAQDLTFQATDVYGALFQGIVEYVSGLAGDANGDGKVDIFDVAVVSNQWGTTGPEGDVNSDGTVDIFDVALISNNWSPGATAVPEPSSALLTALALAGLSVCVRMRKR